MSLHTAEDTLREAAAVLTAFAGDRQCMQRVTQFADAIAQAFEAGGTVMSCGNGGSMCDAMHFAEEWTGRFRKDRRAMPAMAFSDPSELTCIANDFGFAEVFARMVRAHGRPHDLLVLISTSGESENLVRAAAEARALGIRTVGLLGKGGGRLAQLIDIPIVVPLATTSDRIQEIHIKVIHTVIEMAERRLFPENYG